MYFTDRNDNKSDKSYEMKMNDQTKSNDQWQPCPKGTLAEYADRQVRMSSHRRWAAGIGITAIALLAIFLVNSFQPISPSGEPNYGGITCTQVRLNLSSYTSGSVESSTGRRIADHLRQCPTCQQLVARSKRKALSDSPLAMTIPSQRY
jgi:hypothetical protein